VCATNSELIYIVQLNENNKLDIKTVLRAYPHKNIIYFDYGNENKNDIFGINELKNFTLKNNKNNDNKGDFEENLSINSVHITQNDNNIISCSNDCKIRFWNRNNYSKSYIISGDLKYSNDSDKSKEIELENYKYETDSENKLIINEFKENSKFKESGFNNSVPTKHQDSVTDINVLNTNFGNLLVSSSRDGIIKIFK
jgi:WD40 repeat protein